LRHAKSKGVCDVAFHKKRGFAIEDMVKSRWVYRKLRNFRAGIEADISCLKRAYGLARCTWKGLSRFKAYVWSSVFAYNLALLTEALGRYEDAIQYYDRALELDDEPLYRRARRACAEALGRAGNALQAPRG
jgi:tetratricopeptide (TPR) repeat protein